VKATLRAILMLGTAVLGVLAAPAPDASAAALIQTQAPCANGGASCFNFGVGIVGLGQFDIRTFTFRAPSKGNAAVSFHGSLLCGADLSAGNKVVDLVTQITNSAGATAQPNLPGGLRQATVLAPNTSQTLNLASSRMVRFNAAGSQTFHFAVRPLRIDAGTNCYIYNAAFTVIFIP
jgi:hypothetical protein